MIVSLSFRQVLRKFFENFLSIFRDAEIEQTLISDMRKLSNIVISGEQNEYSDVEFHVEDFVFYCHKGIKIDKKSRN